MNTKGNTKNVGSISNRGSTKHGKKGQTRSGSQIKKNPKNFERVSKSREQLEILIDEPLVLQTKDGTVFAGNLEECEPGGMWIYSCMQLADDKSGWTEQTERHTNVDDMPQIDDVPGFDFSEIKSIYRPVNHKIGLDDVLELWRNPHYVPLETIDCPADMEGGVHSTECDAELHDALSTLYTEVLADKRTNAEQMKFVRAFKKIRRFIIENGGRIP